MNISENLSNILIKIHHGSEGNLILRQNIKSISAFYISGRHGRINQLDWIITKWENDPDFTKSRTKLEEGFWIKVVDIEPRLSEITANPSEVVQKQGLIVRDKSGLAYYIPPSQSQLIEGQLASDVYKSIIRRSSK